MNFTKYVKIKYDIQASEAYWTCFAFDGVRPDDLHCTHKYLGNNLDIDAVTTAIDNYFKVHSFKEFKVRFDTPELFGENKDVRVLRPTKDSKQGWVLPLKALLDEHSPDTFPEYKPHVTTDETVVEMPFTRYCLCQGDQILKEWKQEFKQ